jgi:5-methylcytosine-specific restriction protein A
MDKVHRECMAILRRHRARERPSRLIRKYKRALKSYDCMICGFNFERQYGLLGRLRIEVHHTKYVVRMKKNEKVNIKHLIPICANCHKMLHTKMPPWTWKELKRMITTRFIL